MNKWSWKIFQIAEFICCFNQICWFQKEIHLEKVFIDYSNIRNSKEVLQIFQEFKQFLVIFVVVKWNYWNSIFKLLTEWIACIIYQNNILEFSSSENN